MDHQEETLVKNLDDAARLLQQGLSSDTRCASCFEAMPGDARFCASCGAAAPKSETPGDPLRAALEAKLQGQYRIVRLLGRGGMGAVYLARDLALDREVAIKVVSSGSESRDMYERFRREARMAAKLSHPHIVPLHSFGEVEGMPYVVMGYVRGESLASRLRRDGRIGEDEARRIIAEIADALDHAHRQCVVHRDVKPDNVLLDDESGRALLTDFGVAKALLGGESLTQHGSVVGTPHYMSPEQASGRSDLDGRSDLYSLGVTAYAMLAGRLPFEGKTASDVLSQHLTQEPPSLRAFVPTLSDSTVQSIERCLAKDPAKRWSDGRSLMRAVGGATDGDKLPDALEEVSGHGLPYVAISLVLLLLAWMVIIRLQHAPLAVLAVIGGMLIAAYFAIAIRLRLEGFPFALTQRVIWTEPKWWRTWYPRSMRRRGNVWDRLPPSVKRVRGFMPLILVALGVFAANPSEFFFAKAGAMVGVTLVTMALELLARRDVKRRGIAASRDITRIVVGEPTSRLPFWTQPHIAAILAPAAGSDEPRSATPQDQLQSILRMGNEMSGPLRPLGSEAASAARQLVGAIDEADREIADLARNIEPGEAERLLGKIDALRGEESNAMRSLLEKQLELIRGLEGRIEEARNRRNRRAEMLRMLTLHLASLQTRATESSSEISDRVRAICNDIGNQTTIASTPTAWKA